jgi:hypothetical protein
VDLDVEVQLSADHAGEKIVRLFLFGLIELESAHDARLIDEGDDPLTAT